MPPQAPTPQAAFWVSLLSLLFFATLAAMATAWVWAIGRLRSGRTLIDAPKPRRVPWGTGSVLVVFFAWLAVNLGVSVVYLAASGAGKAKRIPTPTEQMAVVSVINGFLLVVVPLLLHLTSRARLEDLGIDRRVLADQARAGAVAFLLISPLVYTLNGLAVLVFEQNKHPLEQMVVGEPSLGIACLAVLSAVVLAPAAEELIFRGVIQGWLTRQFLPSIDEEGLSSVVDPAADAPPPAPEGPARPVDDDGGDWLANPGDGGQLAHVELVTEGGDGDPRPDPGPGRGPTTRTDRRGGGSSWPIVITSAVFAAVHLPQWPAPLAIFFLSLGLGAVYQRTGSLVASFVMHALFNGLGTLMLFVAILAGRPAAQSLRLRRLTPRFALNARENHALSRCLSRAAGPGVAICFPFSIGAGPGIG